jgi:hypothetical protein
MASAPPWAPAVGTSPTGRETPRREQPRLGLGARIAIALGIAAAVIVGVVVVFSMMQGTAADPSDLADRFPEAGVMCIDFDVLYNEKSSKGLGCRTDWAHLISIMTWGNRPSADEYFADWCATLEPASIREGAYLIGDGFIINITQLPYSEQLFVGTPPTPEEDAEALASVLGGQTATYTCP